MTTDVGLMRRRLGDTDIWLPAIGQGTTGMGPVTSASPESDQQHIAALRLGIEMGLDFIDTAELYGGGHAEEVVGRAIRGFRAGVFLASKFNPSHGIRRGPMEAVEGSLRRLGTDYLDLYQAHWLDPRIALDETLRALQDLVDQGKVRFVGLSNVAVTQLEAVQAAGVPRIASVQAEFHPYERDVERALLPHCRRTSVTLMAYSVLRFMSLASGTRAALLESIARRYDRTVAQLVIRWALARPSVIVLIKASSVAHIPDNVAALSFDLQPEDVRRIDDAFRPCLATVAARRIGLPRDTPYRSVQAARVNAGDLAPSPALIAAAIECGAPPRPLRVRATATPAGVAYELIDNALLYWGWVIARGQGASVPVSVIGTRDDQAEEAGGEVRR